MRGRGEEKGGVTLYTARAEGECSAELPAHIRHTRTRINLKFCHEKEDREWEESEGRNEGMGAGQNPVE